MELREFHSLRMPGLSLPFDLAFTPGLNILTGPNGSGKSSVARALAWLLWPDRIEDGGLRDVRAEFLRGGIGWEALGRAGSVAWMRAGEPASPPDLPAGHLAACYHLDILDLILPDPGRASRDFARKLVAELAGGLDAEQLRNDLFAPGELKLRARHKTLKTARDQVREIMQEQQSLATRRAELEDLAEKKSRAAVAGRRSEALAALQTVQEVGREIDGLRREQDSLPEPARSFRSEDPETFGDLQSRLARDRQALEAGRAEEDRAGRQLAGLKAPADGDRTALAAELDERLEHLREADDRIEELTRQRDALPHDSGKTGDSTPAAEISAQTLDAVDDAWNRFQAADQTLRALEAVGSPARPSRWLRLAAVALAVVAGSALLIAGRPLLAVLAAAAGLALAFFAYLRPAAPAGPGSRRAELERQRDQARTRLASLLEELGLDLDLTTLTGPVLLAQVQRRVSAQEQRENLERTLEAASETRRARLRELNGRFSSLGLPEADDLAAARGLRTGLLEEMDRRDELRRRIAEHQRRNADLEAACREHETLLSALCERLGLDVQRDGLDEIRARGRDHARYLALEKEITARQAVIDEAQPRTGPLGDLFPDEDPRSWDPARLEERIAAEQDRRDELAQISEQHARLEERIDRAGRGHALEDALAARRQAEDDLAGSWRVQVENDLGGLVLDSVLAAYEEKTRPAALVHADKLLRSITGRDYALHCRRRTGDRAEFLVHDGESGLDLEPSQLSTGTRTQLLLAVRLGFLMATGPEDHPPLILDDVLTTSDPERFAAAVAGLGRLARDHDLQVISLCARPSEVEAWMSVLARSGLDPANVVDLATARGRAAAAGSDILQVWSPENTPGPPPPAGMDSDQYGAELGVPRPRLHAPATALHLFYLLSDRLDLLYTLLESRVDTVGRWLRHGPSLRESGAVAAEDAQTLEGRIRTWQSLVRLVRRGRPPLVTAGVLAAGPLEKSKKRDEVLGVLDEVEGVAAELLEALRDGRVPRMQKALIERLEADLRERGLLTDAAPLEPDDMVPMLIAESRSWPPEVRPDTQTIHLLVDRLAKTLEP